MQALILGNFDGVHLGHLALVAAAREAVGVTGSVRVLVLHPHPAEVLGRSTYPRLTGLSERLERLLAGGVDHSGVLPVTPEFMATPPEAFLRELWLRERFDVLVEGPDFRFGLDRGGDLSLARKVGEELGFIVVEVPEKVIDIATNVSIAPRSSVIRRELASGNLEVAARLLGRSCGIRGVVQRGAGQARLLGWPTANIDPAGLCVPPVGVFAGAGRPVGAPTWHPAAIHLGPRPSQPGLGDSLEAVLLGVDALPLQSAAGLVPAVGEYGWSLELQFHRRLRDIKKFSDVGALQAQIREDARLAVAQFGARCSIAP